MALTGFKHIGIFPEQANNWEFISNSVKKLGGKPNVLNLFAYTGGASLAAKQAGADVIHLDSVKQVVSWSRQNMELSGLTDIRWLIEDARKFVQREVKRGRVYQGIMLDPPAYGLGPNGERWKLEEQLSDMMEDVYKLLDPERHFLVVNAYSLGLSSLILRSWFEKYYQTKSFETGELYPPQLQEPYCRWVYLAEPSPAANHLIQALRSLLLSSEFARNYTDKYYLKTLSYHTI